MGSREKDQTTSHHPLLSSLVVRPTDSVGGGGAPGGGGAGSDYEPGEVRRDPPPYSRSDRYPSDDRGYRMRAGSVSPVRRRDADRRYSPGFDHSGAPPRGRGFGSGRDLGRYREHSPPYGRGRGGGRFGRVYDGPGYGPGPFRGEGLSRNNPNVRPREGDWVCPDPSCKNLNFARREHCNNCNRFRYAPAGSPRRGYPGPAPPPTRRFPGPPIDRSPGRIVNGYRSPPRGWARDGPRDLRASGPPRNEGRFPEPPIRRDEPDFPVNDFRDRYRFDRPVPLDLGPRDRGRDSFINERRGGYERRPISPLPAAPARGQWARDIRERSRSPVRGGPPPKDYHRDIYMDRGRDDRRGMGRVAF
ncbi:RNA-binding protein-related [Abeliophyllum distichum]|uniref:RNA-binding protein-related n=1 Tax=Abeliophyllum distichum TaxID=126358 RepID=A0ABD1QUB0_9LAMI